MLKSVAARASKGSATRTSLAVLTFFVEPRGTSILGVGERSYLMPTLSRRKLGRHYDRVLSPLRQVFI